VTLIPLLFRLYWRGERKYYVARKITKEHTRPKTKGGRLRRWDYQVVYQLEELDVYIDMLRGYSIPYDLRLQLARSCYEMHDQSKGRDWSGIRQCYLKIFRAYRAEINLMLEDMEKDVKERKR
jgi:hypothetical protein